MGEVKYFGAEASDSGDFKNFGNFSNVETKKKWFENHYRTLFNRIKGLYYHVYKSGLTESEIDDLAQDVVTRVYERADSFKRESLFFTWVAVIAVNIARDYLKKTKRRLDLRPDATIDDFSGDAKGIGYATKRFPAELTSESHEDRVINGVDLSRATAGLDKQQQYLLKLKYVEGLNERQIAEILQMPVGTVKSKLHRTILLIFKNYGKTIRKTGGEPTVAVKHKMRGNDILKKLTPQDLNKLGTILSAQQLEAISFRLENFSIPEIAKRMEMRPRRIGRLLRKARLKILNSVLEA